MQSFCYSVYVHKNKANGKVYVGITSKKPEARWGNGRNYTHNRHFMAAIKKYGWDGFDHAVIREGLTEDQAKSKEVSLISAFRATEQEFGYNMSVGGENGRNGCKASEETRKKMSQSRTGKKMSEQARANISKSRVGIVLSNEHRANISKATRGKKLSDEHIQKIKEASTGRTHSEESKKKMSDASKGKPKSPEHAKKCREASLGFRHTAETRKKVSEACWRTKRVVCIETNTVYPSIKSAELDTGVLYQHISGVCRGERKTAGGYHWMYYDGSDNREETA